MQNQFDDTMTSNEIGKKCILQHTDLIPAFLILFAILANIAVSLGSFYGVKIETDRREPYEQLERIVTNNLLTRDPTISFGTSALAKTSFLFSILDLRVTYDQFKQFSAVSIAEGSDMTPYIYAIVFLNFTSNNDRKSLIKEKEQEGYKNFDIKVQDEDTNKLVPSAVRDIYLPALMIYPLNDVTIPTMGFDHLSDPIRSNIINCAISTKSICMSQRVVLPTGDYGISLYYHVTTKRNNTRLGSGIMTVALKLDNLITSMNSFIKFDEICLTVIDRTTNSFLYSSDPGILDENNKNPTILKTQPKDITITYSINRTIVGHVWEFNFGYYPRMIGVISSTSQLKYIGMITSNAIMFFFISAVLIFYGLFRIYQSQRIRSENKRRISELNMDQNKLTALFKRIMVSEEKTNHILDALDDIILVLDSQGVVLRTNNSFDETFNLPYEDLSDISLINILPNLPQDFYKVNGALSTQALNTSGHSISCMVMSKCLRKNIQSTSVEEFMTIDLDRDTKTVKSELDEAYLVIIRRDKRTGHKQLEGTEPLSQ
ncbi:hypothetical protein AKO1_009640 [Acrasis kona]|uniref:PAS domain-containing protein n=1 Tax=Acrasis kona TaxID=1008807 RepID=A0AAW2ZNN8_9EUKA